MAKLLDVVLMVGGALALYYAYQKGYLEDIMGQLTGALGGGGGAAEPAPAPEAPAEEAPKEEEKPKEEPKKEDKKKKSTKKSKLALALVGSSYDGSVMDRAYFVTEQSFIPRSRQTIGVVTA